MTEGWTEGSYPVCYFHLNCDCTSIFIDRYTEGKSRCLVSTCCDLFELQGATVRGALLALKTALELRRHGSNEIYRFVDGPKSVTWDPYSGSFLAIDGQSIVRLLPPAGGGLDGEGAWGVSLLAGDRESRVGAKRDGRGKAARFLSAHHLTCDQRGVAYVADGSLVRKVQLPESMRCQGHLGGAAASVAPGAAAAAEPAAEGAAEVTTLAIEGWPSGDIILGVRHLPAGSAWGPEECLIFTTRTAVYRLLLGPGGPGGAAPQLLAGQTSSERAARHDGSGAGARFSSLRSGIEMDADNQLLLLDWEIRGGVTRLRLVAPGGSVSTVAGVSLSGEWTRPMIMPNGYLAAYDHTMVQPVGDLDEEDWPRAYWTSNRVAVIATSFTPLALVATAAAAGPPPRSLPADLGALLEDAQQPGGGGTADLVIRVGERRFHCHRAILSARCDYFKHRLAGGAFADAAASELELPDADPDTFALLLRWLYTGGADILPNQARGVAELADRLLLPELCCSAQDVLFASVDAGSIVDSLLWAAGCCEGRVGGVWGTRSGFTRVLARLKTWYVSHHEEVRRGAGDSRKRLAAEAPELHLELTDAVVDRALRNGKRTRV